MMANEQEPEWDEAAVGEGVDEAPTLAAGDDALPLGLAGRDQPQLVLYVFLACLAMHYLKWAASHKNAAEVRRSTARPRPALAPDRPLSPRVLLPTSCCCPPAAPVCTVAHRLSALPCLLPLLQSPEVEALKEEIAELKRSIKLLDPVSQFVQVSKTQRTMIKKEKALAALTGVSFWRCQRPIWVTRGPRF